MNLVLNTRELAESIQKLIAQAGEADEKMIEDVQRLRDEQASTDTRKTYDQAIEALKKSQTQKAIPLRRQIAQALVAFGEEHGIPLCVSDKPVRRRRNKKSQKKNEE